MYDDLRHLMTLMTGDEKHTEAATSTLDVIWVLYDRILRVSPETVDESDRDRFLLSKGHGPMAYYAVLSDKGFIPEAWLPEYGQHGSRLGFHPDRTLIPGVEISSGSLGHGLPLGVGVALGRSTQQGTTHGGLGSERSRIVVLVGDAELDEGTNHEAIVYAGAIGLDMLTVVAVDNRSSTYHWRGGIAPHFEVAGWSARTVDGHDHDALEKSFLAAGPGRPHLVVAEV